MKKETLEEAAELFFRKKDAKNCTLYKAAKFGAKWQQEQDKNKYSEEEVKEILKLRLNWFRISSNEFEDNKWFEQFKKQ